MHFSTFIKKIKKKKSEKQIGQGAKAGRSDPGSGLVGRQVARNARQGTREGAAGKGEGRRGEAPEGGGGAVQARADGAEGALWSGPQDGAVRVFQGGALREGQQVQVQP